MTNKSFESYMLTRVLITSLGLFAPNSTNSHRFSMRGGKGNERTRPSINRFRLPIRTTIIFHLRLLNRSNGFVFIHQRISRIIVSDEVCDYTSDCIWSFAEVTTDGICDFEKENSRWVYDSETFDGCDVLREDEAGVCAWVEETFGVSEC